VTEERRPLSEWTDEQIKEEIAALRERRVTKAQAAISRSRSSPAGEARPRRAKVETLDDVFEDLL
jgi:hypothetical protein